MREGTYSRRGPGTGSVCSELRDDHIESVLGGAGEVRLPCGLAGAVGAGLEGGSAVDEFIDDEALILLPVVLAAAGLACGEVGADEGEEVGAPRGGDGVLEAAAGDVDGRAGVELECW